MVAFFWTNKSYLSTTSNPAGIKDYKITFFSWFCFVLFCLFTYLYTVHMWFNMPKMFNEMTLSTLLFIYLFIYSNFFFFLYTTQNGT